MSDRGKIDAEVFERVIAPALGASRDDVALGPTAGVDFGVLDVGGRALVTATDPLSILPRLGLECAGRLAADIVLTDVAVSGISPTHLTVNLTLPGECSTDSLATLWQGIDTFSTELGVHVVATHVGQYPGVDSSWVGSATAFGVGAHEDLVRPDDARPGDALVVSTGPAAEVAGLFGTLYPEALDLPAETVALAQERVDDIPAVADALAAHAAGGVTAMHDATEGGIAGGLLEMARGADVRFTIDRDAVPVADGVRPVCEAVGVDPWRVTSCGTLLIAVDAASASDVVDALVERGTPAAVVGHVEDGDGVVVDGDRLSAMATDPSWAAAEGLAKRQE